MTSQQPSRSWRHKLALRTTVPVILMMAGLIGFGMGGVEIESASDLNMALLMTAGCLLVPIAFYVICFFMRGSGKRFDLDEIPTRSHFPLRLALAGFVSVLASTSVIVPATLMDANSTRDVELTASFWSGGVGAAIAVGLACYLASSIMRLRVSSMRPGQDTNLLQCAFMGLAAAMMVNVYGNHDKHPFLEHLVASSWVLLIEVVGLSLGVVIFYTIVPELTNTFSIQAIREKLSKRKPASG